MSSLLAVIIAVGNLNNRSEVVAMRAAGVSFFHMIKPYLFLGILITLFLYFHQKEMVSQAYNTMQKTFKEIYSYNVIAFVQPGIFVTLDKTSEQQRIIYVEKKYKDKDQVILKNIQIKTLQRTPHGYRVTQLIIAKEGTKIKKISPSGREAPALRLFGGHAVIQDRKENEIQIVDLKNSSFDLHLTIPDRPTSFQTRASVNDMSSEDLLEKYHTLRQNGSERKTYNPYIVEYHKRIALSFSVLFFILLGFPVAIVNQRTGKGFGLGLSVIFIFLYYTFYFATGTLSMKTHLLPPALLAWLGNLVLGAMSFYFFRKRLFIFS